MRIHGDMLKLILDHDYKQPFPAVDTSPFSNHGVVLNASHLPHGARLNTGALHFTHSSSSVRAPMRQCWQRIGSIAVEAMSSTSWATGGITPARGREYGRRTHR